MGTVLTTAAMLASMAPGSDEAGQRTRYVIVATLDPGSSTIEGSVHIEWTNPGPSAVDGVALDLYLNAFANPGTVYRMEGSDAGVDYEGSGGIALGSVLVNGVAVTPVVDTTHAMLDLPSLVQPHETAIIAVQFESRLPPLVERTGCVKDFCFAGQWYPKVMRLGDDGTWPFLPYHHNSEYDAGPATHEVTIRVPEGWTLAANGSAVRVDGPAGLDSWWFENDVKDVAFAAGRQMRSLEGESFDGEVKLVVAYPAGKKGLARATMKAVRESLVVMDRLYGPYPYETLVTVIVPRAGRGAGGMEYPGLVTTYGTDPGWSPVRVRALVLFHELVHQVFFAKLDSDEAREPWLDEGLTSYGGLRLQAEVEGTGEPLVVGMGGVRLSGFDLQRLALIHESRWPGARLRAWDYATIGEYHAGVYARPAIVLETVRRVWGEKKLEHALRGLATAHAGKRIRSDDVLGRFREVYGARFVEAFFVPALDDGEPFDLSVRIEDGAAVVTKRGLAQIPFVVWYRTAEGIEREVPVDGVGAVTRIEAGQGGQMTQVLVDPENRVLMDANRLDNAATTGAGASFARPVALAALFTSIVQILWSVLMP